MTRQTIFMHQELVVLQAAAAAAAVSLQRHAVPQQERLCGRSCAFGRHRQSLQQPAAAARQQQGSILGPLRTSAAAAGPACCGPSLSSAQSFRHFTE